MISAKVAVFLRWLRCWKSRKKRREKCLSGISNRLWLAEKVTFNCHPIPLECKEEFGGGIFFFYIDDVAFPACRTCSNYTHFFRTIRRRGGRTGSTQKFLFGEKILFVAVMTSVEYFINEAPSPRCICFVKIQRFIIYLNQDFLFPPFFLLIQLGGEWFVIVWETGGIIYHFLWAWLIIKFVHNTYKSSSCVMSTENAT